MGLERAFDAQLEDLKKLILVMGGHVEKSVTIVSEALLQKDVEAFTEVHEIEKRINEAQVAVDNACVALLAKQGPVASDLRLILSIIKINTDLERMGDQCVNVAFTGKDFLFRNPQIEFRDISRMADLVKQVVKHSLDSFVNRDVELAKKVLLTDDEIDGLKDRVFEEMIGEMKANNHNVEACLDLILIARNFERLGDHATNIAEDVIFAVTGRDIRHGGKYK